MGNLLYIKVHSAGVHDTIEGCNVVYQTFKEYSSIMGFGADQGYRGTTKNFTEDDLRIRMDISEKSQQKGFHVIKKRWVIERFFAWLGGFRRLSRDYEIKAFYSKQMITVAAVVLNLRRYF
jgi:putative transposase